MRIVRMMIVEDEDILREGIRKVGDWEAIGVEICGLAANGAEALLMIAEKKPDIILTDVVMPLMDGIELTRQVYEKYPEIKVIILSGHEEFQYVKSAIEYKACSYLLKPAKIEKISEAVSAVRDELLITWNHQEEEARMREKLQQSLPVLREHYLTQIISGGIELNIDVKNQFEFLGIGLREERLAVLVCELDKMPGKDDVMSKRISYLALREICEQVIGQEYTCCVFQDIEDRIVILLNYPSELPVKTILVYLSGKGVRIQKDFHERCEGTASIGIGRLARQIGLLSKSYKEAKAALTYKFFMGNQSIIYIGDVERKDEGNWQFLEQSETEILTCVKAGDAEGALSQTKRYFELVEKLSFRDTQILYEELSVFIINLLRTLRQKDGVRSAPLIEEPEQFLMKLRKNTYPTFRELRKEFEAVIEHAAAKVNEDRLLRSEGLIDKARKYVTEHLSQDVSLITVADAVYISPNYLSFLFKENGENFKDYVVGVKMQKAEEMLESGQYNFSQIAYALGYKDGRYFSQVYKKYREKR